MYKYKIESLTCMSCFFTIEDALKEFDSSIKASADVKNLTLVVESTQSADKLKSVIEAAGYPVSSTTVA